MPNPGYEGRHGDKKDRERGTDKYRDDRRQPRRRDRDVEVVAEKRSSRAREHAGDRHGVGRGADEQGSGPTNGGHDQGVHEISPIVQSSNNRGGRAAGGGGNSQHDDSGFGQQMPPYDDPYYGGYGRGGWFGVPHQGHYMGPPGFGRGMPRPPYSSTPNFGRGWGSPRPRFRGKGKWRGGPESAQRGDSMGSGTANEILAKCVKELEAENTELKEKLKNDTPKKKTVADLDNIKEKNEFLKNRVQTMETLVDEKNEEIAKLKNLESILEEFNMTKEKEDNFEELILKECSPRVKKHLKIIIEDKMSQEDMRSCLSILLCKLDRVHVWGSMLRIVEETDSQQVRDELIERLGGGVGRKNDINGGIEYDDSAPSSDSDEDLENVDNGKLEPRKLSFEEAGAGKPGAEVPTPKVLDSATKRKVRKNQEEALKVRNFKRKDNAEKEANAEMETGQAGASSPIIKKKKAQVGPKNKKAKMDEPKVCSLGGISIRVTSEGVYDMKDLIQKAEGGGTRMLDKKTGDLIKKIPCGFYSACTNVLDKDARVRGGVLFEPEGHRKEGKIVYVCLEHEVKIEAEPVEDAGNEEGDGNEELDDLETSVMEEEEEFNEKMNENSAVLKDDNDDGDEEAESAENQELLSQSIFQK